MDNRNRNTNVNPPPNINKTPSHTQYPDNDKSEQISGKKRRNSDNEATTSTGTTRVRQTAPNPPTTPSRSKPGKQRGISDHNPESSQPIGNEDTDMEDIREHTHPRSDDPFNTPEHLNAQQTIDNIYTNLKEVNEYMVYLHSMKAAPLARMHSGIRENIEFLSTVFAIDSLQTLAKQQIRIVESIASITDTITSMQANIKTNHTELMEKIESLQNHNPVSHLKPETTQTTDSWSAVAKRAKPSNTHHKSTSNETTTTPHPPQDKHLATTISRPHNNPNPDTSHHPSRLVIQYHPDGILDKDKDDPEIIVQTVNTALSTNEKSAHLKVVAARFNPQGNLILSTRSDQTAAELIKHADLFIPKINKGYQTTTRVDKRWFKIQVDGVSTTKISIGGERTIRGAEEVHKELATCNPYYAQILNSITATPRWMRTKEELLTTNRSSVVFAVDQETIARRFLDSRTLAAFGRHCSLRAYQDRPPITQCKNCWGWDHKMEHCKLDPRCRLCAKEHPTEEHTTQECIKCNIQAENGDLMDTRDGDTTCNHQLRCINCMTTGKSDTQHAADARQCPTRIEKYGTVRDIERKARNAENPWTVVAAGKKATRNKPKTTNQQRKESANSQQNQFKILMFDAMTMQDIEEPTPSDPNNSTSQHPRQ